MMDPSARISFFQVFREFLTKSLHLRASCGFPVIALASCERSGQISAITSYMATFCSIQWLTNFLSILPKTSYMRQNFSIQQIISPNKKFQSQSLFLFNLRCRVFSFLLVSLFCSQNSCLQCTLNTILPFTIKTSPNYFFISRDTSKSYRGRICRFFS